LKTFLTLGLSVGAVGVVVAGGLAAGSFLSGAGTQPEDVLPASTIGFLKIDLNPPVGQKINVLRLMEKLPDVDRRGDDLKRTVVEALLVDSGLDLAYVRDVEPWLGDRVAVGAVPSLEERSEDPVAPLVVIQFTDEQAMRAALDRAEQTQIASYADTHSRVGETSADGADTAVPGTDPGTGNPVDPVGPVHPDDYDPFDYAVRDGYVIISEHQQQVDAAAAATTVLSEKDTFAADKTAVEGSDQIVLGWLDVAAVYAAVPEDEQSQFAETFGSAKPAGRVVMGVHAESDAIEAVGRSFDLEAAGTQAIAAGGPGSGLVLDLPETTDVAFSATGLGTVAADLWERYGEDSAWDLGSEAEAMGLRMPEDLVAMLGQEATVGADLEGLGQDGEFSVTARVATEDPERALEVLDQLARLDPSGALVHTATAPDGYVAGNNEEQVAAAADGDMALGNSAAFADAVPDADDASALLFVDIGAVMNLFSSWGASGDPDGSDEVSDWELLEAFGVTATGENGNGEFKARLTFR
jgi:hypothetical protein